MQVSKALRSAIHRQRESGRTKATRYSSRLKAAVADHVRSRRSAGVPFATLSMELGLPVNTLRRWVEGGAGGASKVASVEVIEGPRSSSPVLVTPSGHRVEGLSLGALAELLVRLT